MVRKHAAVLFGISTAICLAIGETASAESVVVNKAVENQNGYPCSLTLKTDESRTLIFQLSDYKDIWSLNLIVADRADTYRNFFDSRGLRDEKAFEKAFATMKIGDATHHIHDAVLLEVQKVEVNEDTTGWFTIQEKHNVAHAIQSMTKPSIAIAGLFTVENTVQPTEKFRACAYQAMGLVEGQKIETDVRAEYRMIFERSFEVWITSMARADMCLVGGFDETAVDSAIDAAASAFIPGLFNMGKRGKYRDDLKGKVPLAKLNGTLEAASGGCLLAGDLARMSRMPVDESIKAAERLD